MADSSPPSPLLTTDSLPSAPGQQMSPSHNSTGNTAGMGYFSIPFERFAKDEFSGWTSGFTLLDTIETYFDSRLDLLERRLKKHSDKLKTRAGEALKRTKSPMSDFRYAVDLEKEMLKFKVKVSTRMTTLAATWQSTKVVRTREKISFFLGVMAVAVSALMFGLAPSWVHIAYTVGALILIPMRAYTYKKKSWHYFLFDLCYYANIICLVCIWVLPASPTMFVSAYCLAHGSLASAVITWRNSLVFHDSDKVTSLFIHLYPPFTFTVIRHFYPNAEARFPALAQLPHLEPVKALFLSGLIYMVWQALYWKFVLIDRRKKIESGQRTTSFSFLLNDKRGAIGRMLSSVPPQYRESSFMAGQLAYALITELPAVFVLYDSPLWSGVFLLCIFAVSVWNGGGFYIEVFGRKFERELEALRKELAEATTARPGAPSTSGRTSPTPSDAEASSNGSPVVTGIETSSQPDPLSLDSNSSQSLLFTTESTIMDTKKDR
ncbi:hypothetical protein JB92DRAFT_2896136 [Gautieria morchelliformis]|nr:hypothetical protein JB92DRAFT_2896136 [Gautieria morchelliformis]